MDKRQIKSQKAILNAMKNLLNRKDYGDIAVNDILKESGVSRSAFYANFDGKEGVLRGLCGEIFSHVYEPTHKREEGHDFSSSSIFDYKMTLSHIYCHFHEEKELFGKIIASSASPIFSDELTKRIHPLMEAIVKGKLIHRENIPDKLLVLQLDSGFVALLKHWIEGGCRYNPEEIAEVFLGLYA